MKNNTISKFILILVAVLMLFAVSCQMKPAQTLPPKDADGKFTIAIIPDTQQEVVVEQAIQNRHFRNRIEWLTDNAENLDLRFVIHTGDVVNWGNEDPKQFEIASEAMKPLDEAGIPIAVCLGNHDTAAVGVGGSAADPSNTRVRLRNTKAFNQYFSTERYDELIPFEKGKVDNAYQLFEAAGYKWMVMNLELWPRSNVVDWANRVIEEFPDYNVIIATHSYLTDSGNIYQKADYGHTSPMELYDNLISKHANIKLVFSGHVGYAYHRVDYGENGNKIASFLGCFHSNLQNPVQLMEIDAENGSVSVHTYSPIDDTEWRAFKATINEMTFISPEKGRNIEKLS